MMSDHNQIVYIASNPHSGSTWLSYVLGTHPKAATLGEHHRRFEGAGDVECRHCQCLGLPRCEVLHGINAASIEEAYSLPMRRFSAQGVTTLIDNSKQVPWLKRLIDAKACHGVTVRVIHLVRDPRGWIASCLSRSPSLSVPEALEEWKRKVVRMQADLEELGLPVLKACYDVLCLDPRAGLAVISGFTGLEYELDHLAYWERVHHSMGANGASISVLPGRRGRAPDKGYYLERFRQTFHDDRWRHLADGDAVSRVSLDDDADRLLRGFGGGFPEIDRLLSSGSRG